MEASQDQVMEDADHIKTTNTSKVQISNGNSNKSTEGNSSSSKLELHESSKLDDSGAITEKPANNEATLSVSSKSSSSVTLSDEETPEQKAAYKQHCKDLKAKYGLDKLPHFDKLSKMTQKVRYYTIERKRKHREELSLDGWQKLRLYRDNDYLQNLIDEPDEVSTINVDRVHVNDISVEEFMERYEKPSIPVILVGCTEGWDAHQKWNFPDLLKKYQKCKLKIGEDDDGYPLKLKLKHFIEYLVFNKDDSPLYLFQSSIESRRKIKDIVQDYQVPKFFQDDYFKIIGSDDRPPYRWFLVGPQRSGSTIHIDPLSTSAWNASIQGHKKWILFPPHYEKDFVKGKQFKEKKEDDEAIHYFKYIYPRILASGKVEKRYEFVQRPGETVYVPGKWWH